VWCDGLEEEWKAHYAKMRQWSLSLVDRPCCFTFLNDTMFTWWDDCKEGRGERGEGRGALYAAWSRLLAAIRLQLIHAEPRYPAIASMRSMYRGTGGTFAHTGPRIHDFILGTARLKVEEKMKKVQSK